MMPSVHVFTIHDYDISPFLFANPYFRPLVQEKLILEVEAMDKIRKAQGDVCLLIILSHVFGKRVKVKEKKKNILFYYC